MKLADPGEEEKTSIGVGDNQDIGAAKKAIAEGGKEGAQAVPIILSVQKVSMARFAQLLGPFGNVGHVADETNLKGFYDAKLALESGEAVNGPLQAQLGLKLEARKIPIEMFVVDSAEKPAAN